MNFGLFFTWWDRLLGTLKLDAARNPSAGDIGIQDHGEFPQHYMTQLVLPFTGTIEQPQPIDARSTKLV